MNIIQTIREVFARKNFEENKKPKPVSTTEYIDSMDKQWETIPMDTYSLEAGNIIDAYKPIADNYIVRSSEQLVRATALITPYHISCQDEKENAKSREMVEYLEDVFDNLDVPFKNLLDGLLDCRTYGYVIAEKIFSNKYKNGLQYLTNIKFHNLRYFELKKDKYGYLEKIIFHSLEGMKEFVNPYEKFIIGTYPYLVDANYFGTSELYYIRDLVREYEDLNKMLDKGLQFIAVKPYLHYFDADLPSDNIEKAKQAIDKVDNRSVIHLPMVMSESQTNPQYIKQHTIEVVGDRASTEGLKQLKEQLERKEKNIRRCMGVPDDLGFTTQLDGSFARARVQQNLFIAKVEQTQLWLESVINNQVIKQLIDLNFENVEYYPYFFFEETEEGVTADKVDNMVKLSQAGIINGKEKWIRKEYLVLPEMEEIEEEPIENPIENTDNMPTDENIEEIEIDKNIEIEKPIDDPNTKLDVSKKNKNIVKKADKFAYQKLEYDTTDYTRLEKQMDEIDETSITTAEKGFGDLQNDMINSIPKTLQSGDIPNAKMYNDKTIKTIQNIYDKALIDSYLLGVDYSVNFMKKLGIDSTSQNYIMDADLDMTNTLYIKELSKKLNVILTKADKESLRLAIQQSGMTTKEQVNMIEKKIKQILMNYTLTNGNPPAIETKSLQALTKQVNDAFLPYIKSGIINGASAEPYRVETAIRTMTTSYQNQARMNTFRRPEYSRVVRAYRYSATLDGRTTEICRAYHGHTIEADDPVLNSIVPPNHFNCRSIMYPIIAGQDYTAAWDYSIKPDKGFMSL